MYRPHWIHFAHTAPRSSSAFALPSWVSSATSPHSHLKNSRYTTRPSPSQRVGVFSSTAPADALQIDHFTARDAPRKVFFEVGSPAPRQGHYSASRPIALAVRRRSHPLASLREALAPPSLADSSQSGETGAGASWAVSGRVLAVKLVCSSKVIALLEGRVVKNFSQHRRGWCGPGLVGWVLVETCLVWVLVKPPLTREELWGAAWLTFSSCWGSLCLKSFFSTSLSPSPTLESVFWCSGLCSTFGFLEVPRRVAALSALEVLRRSSALSPPRR